jgi:hypothetical protein
MKKIIKGKSYNTEFDSELVAKYHELMDGWAHTSVSIYRKKSTGEYFKFDKWSSWNDGWDIFLIDSKTAKAIVKKCGEGMTHKYFAAMEPFPGTKSKGYFWGKEEDNPWDEEMVAKKKEEWKKEKEEIIRKSEEAAKAKEEAGEKTWGVMRITGASDGCKFGRLNGKEIPSEKKGVVRAHKINLRLENNDKGNGYNCAYRYTLYVVLDKDDKAEAKKVAMDVINSVIAEKGEFEAVMKGGHIVDKEPVKNGQMMKDVHKRIQDMNNTVIWGEA